LDKAPDAFRTISEVADDLDIPQHVLRFWETRFTQIKPMKRSGGRRYYRPDDVDLLRGIRRLLYGEGYTIRGVQRILKEHGVKSVQGLVDGSSAVPSFGAAGDDAMRGRPDAGDDESDVETGDDEIEPADAPAPARRAPAAIGADARKLDVAKLQAALQDLIACRQLLDGVMKEG
jgi:DNA-binding transcriptional MerR regulator